MAGWGMAGCGMAGCGIAGWGMAGCGWGMAGSQPLCSLLQPLQLTAADYIVQKVKNFEATYRTKKKVS